MDSCNRVILNVGGVRYEVSVQTLTRLKDSRLGQMFSPDSPLPQPDKNNEYFFDRNGRLFEFILDYYRNDLLIPPPGMSHSQLLTELEYWKISLPEYLKTDSGRVEAHSDSEDSEKLDRKFFQKSLALRYKKSIEWITSPYVDHINRGIDSMLELRAELQFLEEEKIDHLYYLALGYYRIGLPNEAKYFNERLRELDPDSRLVKELSFLINDTSSNYVKSGVLLFSSILFICFVSIKTWIKTKKNM